MFMCIRTIHAEEFPVRCFLLCFFPICFFYQIAVPNIGSTLCIGAVSLHLGDWNFFGTEIQSQSTVNVILADQWLKYVALSWSGKAYSCGFCIP